MYQLTDEIMNSKYIPPLNSNRETALENFGKIFDITIEEFRRSGNVGKVTMEALAVRTILANA